MAKGWRRYAPNCGRDDDLAVLDVMAKRGLTRLEACAYVLAERARASQEAADKEAIATAVRRDVFAHQRDVADAERRRAEIAERVRAEEAQAAERARKQRELDQIRPPMAENRDGGREPEPVRSDDEKPRHPHKGRKGT